VLYGSERLRLRTPVRPPANGARAYARVKSRSARMERSVHLHDSLGESLAREWDELADRTAAPPFLRPGWVCAWAGAFARGPVRVAALRRDGQLVGVLPLMLRQGAVRSPTNWHTPVFGPVVEDYDAAARLCDWLMGLGARSVSLDFVDSGSAATRAFEEAARAARYRPASRMRLHSPYVELSGKDGVEQMLSAKRRSNLRRQSRRLGMLGPLSLDVDDGREDLDRRLTEAFAVDRSGWKGERGSAIVSRPDTTKFYRDVAAWAAERGWLRILLLRCGGRAIACDIGIDADGSHYLLKTGYAAEYRNYAPGVVLRRDAVARAAAAGLATYEFLGHVEPTKLEWSDACRERRLLQAFRPSPLGALDHALMVHARAVAVRVHDAARRR
jgi:CelD/BcsL family acetyltransferase involved in cellulose biosynthesis